MSTVQIPREALVRLRQPKLPSSVRTCYEIELPQHFPPELKDYCRSRLQIHIYAGNKPLLPYEILNPLVHFVCDSIRAGLISSESIKEDLPLLANMSGYNSTTPISPQDICLPVESLNIISNTYERAVLGIPQSATVDLLVFVKQMIDKGVGRNNQGQDYWNELFGSCEEGLRNSVLDKLDKIKGKHQQTITA